MKNLIRQSVLGIGMFLCNIGIAQENTEPAWAYFADISNSDHVTDLWVTPAGESYIIGHVGTAGSNPEGLMLTKVSTSGEEMWQKFIYADTEDWGLFAKAVLADDAGNVFVVFNERFKYTHFTNNRIVVHKYTPQGELLWSDHYTVEENGPIEEISTDAVVYKNGTLYLAGSSNHLDPSANADGMIVKINGNDGNLIQKIIFNSEYNTDDVFKQLSVDENGNVWAVGRSRGYMWPGGIYSDYDANVVKYNENGEFQWEHRENGTSNHVDFGINITVDNEGNCYTSNQVKSLSISQSKVLVQKLSPIGEVLWAYQYQGSSSGYTWDQPIDLLPNGNVALVFSNEDGINTACLNGSNGTLLWMVNYNRNSMGMANHQRDMITDGNGNIYVTGTSRDNIDFGGGYDMVTLKYDSQGNLEWLSNFNHGDYSTTGDDGVRLMLDSVGNVYAIGWTSYGEDFNDDFLLLKYGNAVMGTEDMEKNRIAFYPNPVTDVAYLSLTETSDIATAMHLVDMNGRIIKRWESIKNDGSVIPLDFSGITPGFYILNIQTGNNFNSFKIYKQ